MARKLTQVFVVCAFLALLGTPKLYGQEDPQYSHYMFNKMVYNPGAVGSANVLDATMLFRNQWLGFSEGTPLTQNLAVHMPVRPLHGGLGLHVVNDLIGVERNTSVRLAYAYIHNFDFGNLAFGINGGISQSAMDGSRLRAPDGSYEPNTPQNHNDDLIPDILVTGIRPDFDFGVYFTRNTLYAGVSMKHLIEPTVEYDVSNLGTVKIKQIRHYYAMAGYMAQINSKVDLQPSVKFKTDATKNQIDLNAILLYNKNLWGGLGLRGVTADNRDAIIAMAGLNLTRDLRLGYSFDITLSRIRSFSAGTHEFMLNYQVMVAKPPKPSRIIHCPRFL